MGCSIFCHVFEAFSTALQRIFTSKLSVPNLLHILNVFISFGPPKTNIASRSLCTFELLAHSLSMPIKHENNVSPATRVILEGIMVDTKTMQFELPQNKLEAAKEKIKELQ